MTLQTIIAKKYVFELALANASKKSDNIMNGTNHAQNTHHIGFGPMVRTIDSIVHVCLNGLQTAAGLDNLPHTPAAGNGG
jgi:hypothetical protein